MVSEKQNAAVRHSPTTHTQDLLCTSRRRSRIVVANRPATII